LTRARTSTPSKHFYDGSGEDKVEKYLQECGITKVVHKGRILGATKHAPEPEPASQYLLGFFGANSLTS